MKRRPATYVALAAAAMLSLAATGDGGSVEADASMVGTVDAAERAGVGACAKARVGSIDPPRVCVWVGWPTP